MPKPTIQKMSVYWVDCSRCSTVLELGTDKMTSARREARVGGWRANAKGEWICANCISNATTLPFI